MSSRCFAYALAAVLFFWVHCSNTSGAGREDRLISAYEAYRVHCSHSRKELLGVPNPQHLKSIMQLLGNPGNDDSKRQRLQYAYEMLQRRLNHQQLERKE